MAFKMMGKGPMMKSLVGKQHNLPEELKAKIEAAPESNEAAPESNSALPRKGVRKGVKTTSHSTKSTRASHQREASLGDKKLNRMNKRLSRQYAKKGDAVTERGSLYDRTNKQFSKAYASATASDKAKYEAKVAKNKDRVDRAKADKNK